MAAFDYIEARADADELLTEFGQAVALRRKTLSGTAWEPVAAHTDYATVAAILDFSKRQIDGVNVLATDRRALIAAGPLVALGVSSIAPPDALVVGGVAYAIVGPVVTLAPAGIVVMFECQLRA